MLKFVAAIAALLFAALAASQDYPSRPIRLIVPFPPGGSTDILARALGDKLAQGLGQPVVIDNRPGAAGSIGAEAAARAAPDGHTLMMGHLGTLAVNPAIYKNLPYDPVKSFAPVSLMAIVPSVLVVNPSLPVTSAAELIAYAKAHPGKLAYGSAGNGSTSHLTTEYFKLVTGTDILHVPYKGVGPMLTDLVSGQLSGVRLGVGDELGRARHRQRRVDDQHARHDGHERHGREALDRIVRQVFVDGRVHRERAEVAHHEGVAVGGGARRGVGAQRG